MFQASTVGLAVAFVSFAGVVSVFTNLGLANTNLRFLSRAGDPGALYTTSVVSVTLFSLLGSAVALALLPELVPKLREVPDSWVLSVFLLALIALNAVSQLHDCTVLALDRADITLYKQLIINLPRLALLPLMVSLALRGIIAGYVFMFVVGVAYNLAMMRFRLLRHARFRFRSSTITAHSRFAISNYFGGLLGILPSTVTPLIIVDRLSAASAAYFFIPFQVVMLLNLVCSSTSGALLAQASRTSSAAEHPRLFRSAMAQLYRVLIPSILAILAIGWPVLRLFGTEYASHGYVPMALLCLAVAFVGVNWLGDTYLNIARRSLAYFLMNGFNALAVLAGVWLLAPRGLVGVGLGWLGGQVLSAVVYLLIFGRAHLLGAKR
jgi:O-antigen/teichoic acid export membrane protein